MAKIMTTKIMTLAAYRGEFEYFLRGWQKSYAVDTYPTDKEQAELRVRHIKTFVSIHMKNFKYSDKMLEKIAGERFILDNPKYFKYDRKQNCKILE